MVNKPFSDELEVWLKSKGTKTIGDLQSVFQEKSFAILFLLFMFIPALPVPTGGITHLVLLPVVMLAALQMIVGQRSLWMPKRVNNIPLGEKTLNKALPFMMRRIRWFERFSRPRLSSYLTTAWFRTFTGICVFIFATGAFVSPPFSGLDTLPSMGAVIIALSLILEDIVLFFIGLIVGSIGIGVIIATAGVITAFFQYYF